MSFQMNQPVKEWFTNNMSGEATILDIAIVKRNTLYAAIRNDKTQEVFCYVYLLRWSRERGYNFSYKPMTEFVGPCESECPERILKVLTALNDQNDPSGYAREWRKRCKETIEKRKELSKGEFAIKANEPINFTSGANYQYFKKIGRRMYAGAIENNRFISYCRVRLNLKYVKYEMIAVTN